MSATLHRSMLMAGDILRIDFECENGSQKVLEYIQVTLKQQLSLLYNAKKNKRFDSCERVYLNRDDSIKTVAAPGKFKRTLEFKVSVKHFVGFQSSHSFKPAPTHARFRKTCRRRKRRRTA